MLCPYPGHRLRSPDNPPTVGVFLFPHPRCEATMALHSTPQLRIMHALAESRRCRHHKECQCHMFDHLFCNAADALWQNRLNRELEAFIPVPH